MRLLLSLLLVSYAFSRDRNDASALIQSVADTASSAKSWRIEGSIEDSPYVQPATFTFYMRAPVEVRFQQIGGFTPAIIVAIWRMLDLFAAPQSLPDSASSESTLSPIVGDWKSLASTLKSPVLAGRRPSRSAAGRTECELVRGKSEATPPLSGEIKRELCIDTSTNLIFSEKDESKDSVRTYTYSKLERDIDMTPDVFVLGTSPGKQVDDLRSTGPGVAGLVCSRSGISMPRLSQTRWPPFTTKRPACWDRRPRRSLGCI